MKPLLPELPVGCTQAEIDEAYVRGLLRKEELKHGAYYRGTCRNAEVARWHAGVERFVYMHTEFGNRYPDAVMHPQDERRYDVFMAVEAIEPAPHQIILDTDFEFLAELRRT